MEDIQIHDRPSVVCVEILHENGTGILKSADPAIDQLPDPLLSEIFSHLTLKDRYQLCLVSRRWQGASRVPWTDITRLSLNAIPRAMVNPILGLCPKIVIIEATDLTILLENKPNLSTNKNVKTMILKNVNFAVPHLADPSYSDVDASFRGHLKRFPNLAELTLHNLSFPVVGHGYSLPNSTATSLQRLVFHDTPARNVGHVSISARELANAECLYVHDPRTRLGFCGPFEMPQLRELCAIGAEFKRLAKSVVEGKFPKLEVLIYASDFRIDPTALGQLITATSALRILVIAGKDLALALKRMVFDDDEHFFDPNQFPVTLPARDIPPHQNSATPSRPRAPAPLQIFVGGDFTKNVRFTLPPSNVAKFWRIDCPMPEYLAKAEVAEIFNDVFVAKIMREGPANGLQPWGHPDKTELFFSTEPLLVH